MIVEALSGTRTFTRWEEAGTVLEAIDACVMRLATEYRRLVGEIIELYCSILGLARAEYRPAYEAPSTIHNPRISREVLIRPGSLVIVGLAASDELGDGWWDSLTLTLDLVAGTTAEMHDLRGQVPLWEAALGAPLTPLPWSPRLDERRGSPVKGQLDATAQERRAAKALLERPVYRMAKRLRETREGLKAEAISGAEAGAAMRTLRTLGLVSEGRRVRCSRTQRVVQTLSAEEARRTPGLCACGRPLELEPSDAVVVAASPLQALLDSSRWLSLVLQAQLLDLGIGQDHMCFNLRVGPDEVDCLADAAGFSVLFELKDKDFTLGNAYSLTSKAALLHPAMVVIVTSGLVTKDAAAHLSSSPVFGPHGLKAWGRRGNDRRPGLHVIEGLASLSSGLREVVAFLGADYAKTLLHGALSQRGGIAPELVLEALVERRVGPETKVRD